MPTINAPSRPFTDTLERGNALTVSCDASGTALVNLRGPSGTVQASTVAAGRSVVYGPYLHDMSVVVSAVSGAVTVTESIADALQFANVPQFSLDPTTGAVTGLVGPSGSDFLVVSSSAPNNADGRPNGTIYIQTA